MLGNMMDELTVTGTEETPEEVAGRYQPLFERRPQHGVLIVPIMRDEYKGLSKRPLRSASAVWCR